MKLGLQIDSFTWPGGTEAIGPTLARVAAQADDVGFDSIWVMDHFFQIRGVGRVEEPMLEGWTTLGYLAAATKRRGLEPSGVRGPRLSVPTARRTIRDARGDIADRARDVDRGAGRRNCV